MKQKLEKILSAQSRSVADMLDSIRNRKIFLYGAGNVGGQMLDVLRQYGIQPVAFLDKNASIGQTKDGVAVLAPDDKSLSRDARGDVFVFVSLILDKAPRLALYEQLKSLGYANLGYGFAWVRAQSPESDKQWKESALKVFDMFEDIHSQTVYSQNLSAVFSDDSRDGFVSPSEETQYFDNTVLL
ncbi:hypothetical protein FACS1894187_03220 [Synergistales bacterium]|nr:hypothetical protein FACS1894187_03220 [Synergistales bacterium]